MTQVTREAILAMKARGKKNVVMTEEKKERAKEMIIEGGYSVSEIAKEIEVPYQPLHHFINRLLVQAEKEAAADELYNPDEEEEPED